MAHFAEINDDNIVLRVICVANSVCIDQNGIEDETIGRNFCRGLFGGNWIQTSYNGNFRKRYAAPEYIYDPINDVFIPPKPYPSWIFDDKNYDWIPPTPYPNDGLYDWDESTQTWTPTLMN